MIQKVRVKFGDGYCTYIVHEYWTIETKVKIVLIDPENINFCTKENNITHSHYSHNSKYFNGSFRGNPNALFIYHDVNTKCNTLNVE